ncbi:nucleoside-diphosphate kinase [Candidatus Woesearchaeota archaeon]|nr:nucleoside-diphosphate kinase [Candidatus Woesearchaeota archaeon]
MIERSLVLLKPDAVQRGFMGEIIMRFERAGLKIVGTKMVWVDKDFAKKHYAEHVEKAFYKGLEKVITHGPVLALAIEGVEAIATVRKMVGGTEPKSAAPGTIRGDYAHVSYGYADKQGIGIKNLIHASANTEDAKKEISLWFKAEEMHSYKTVHDIHILE